MCGGALVCDSFQLLLVNLHDVPSDHKNGRHASYSSEGSQQAKPEYYKAPNKPHNILTWPKQWRSLIQRYCTEKSRCEYQKQRRMNKFRSAVPKLALKLQIHVI